MARCDRAEQLVHTLTPSILSCTQTTDNLQKAYTEIKASLLFSAWFLGTHLPVSSTPSIPIALVDNSVDAT